jgi:hypothetical protein
MVIRIIREIIHALREKVRVIGENRGAAKFLWKKAEGTAQVQCFRLFQQGKEERQKALGVKRSKGIRGKIANVTAVQRLRDGITMLAKAGGHHKVFREPGFEKEVGLVPEDAVRVKSGGALQPSGQKIAGRRMIGASSGDGRAFSAPLSGFRVPSHKVGEGLPAEDARDAPRIKPGFKPVAARFGNLASHNFFIEPEVGFGERKDDEREPFPLHPSEVGDEVARVGATEI